MINLHTLETEARNPNTLKIDQYDVPTILELLNKEDQTIAFAVKEQLPAITQTIQAAIGQLQKGGRLIYIGAGTSGRLGILDASECPPTYGVDPGLVMGLIAGGFQTVSTAKESAEDQEQLGMQDLMDIGLTKNDMVIGLAASGRTPYVIGALKYANELGAQTGSIACVKQSKIGQIAKHPIEVITGPEPIQGSTRMKAGTAQKMVLNMISTTCMIQLGKVYSNMMVDLKPKNEKLIERSKHMIMQALECDYQSAEKLFEDSHRQVKVAILMGLLSLSYDQALSKLERTNGYIAKALEEAK